MDLTMIAIYGGAMALALGGIVLVKKIARKHGDAASQKAKSEIETKTGVTLAHVYAFGQSALGFSDDARVWSLEKDTVMRLEASEVGSWYSGQVQAKVLGVGAASTSNLALKDAGSDVRIANRTVQTFYALIYDHQARLISKVGVLNDADSAELAHWLEKAFPGCAQTNAGTLKISEVR